MKWTQLSKYRIESPEGYIISKSRVSETAVVYIARAPKETGYVYTGNSCGEAKAACNDHLKGRAE